ncbi:MAG: serine/threonine protein kinase, partial [Planctomycetaceae bacterium]|nr:serine/threonine protein kinase [Planctomycetaceae bacterium]
MLNQRFELQAQLSTDDQGTDYRAMDRELQQPVELRFLRPEVETLWPHVVRRCQLTMLINSPGVRSLREFALEASPPYLVFDPSPAQSLENLLLNYRPLRLDHAVSILRAVTCSLIPAHHVGLSHGRLAAKNIGWSGSLEAQNPCLLDFTRCPLDVRTAMTDDIQQLSELLIWMLGKPLTEITDDHLDLKQLFLEMQSAAPENRPSANHIAKRLEFWLGQHAAQQPVRGDARMDHTFIGFAAEMSELAKVDLANSEPVEDHRELRPHSPSNVGTDPLANRQTLGRFKLQSKLGEGGM